MELYLLILIISFMVQVGFAVLLYKLGQQHFDAGVPWALAGFFFGLFGLGAFFIMLLRHETTDRARAAAEYGRMRDVIRHHDQTSADFQTTIHTGIDPEADRLIGAGDIEAAQAYLTEKIRVAWETGDTEREAMYRRYREIIDSRAERLGDGAP